MAERPSEFAIDNDTDLQYIRMLGWGGYGSVHEVHSSFVTEAYLDLLYSREEGMTGKAQS
jgi:hypothetical protein